MLRIISWSAFITYALYIVLMLWWYAKKNSHLEKSILIVGSLAVFAVMVIWPGYVLIKEL
ncbi:MAG: hypothetical protein A2Z93_09000 [Curvibacter sp. GWA2_64_110]|nr:MAG: hypothetical protein A2Z93_09000 [Curvibacter sp. GWA2_64_110]HCY14387.1 hypothetical protein [Curvibacter sp.]